MNTLALFREMLILFGVMLAGFLSAKAGVMNADLNRNLSQLVALLTSPMQILASVLSGARPMENRDVLLMTAIGVCVYVVLIFAAKLLPKLLRLEEKQAGVFQFLLIFSNVGYIGYPIIEALFGEDYRFYATVFVLVFQFFCWTYGVSLLSGEKMRLQIKAFLRPTILSALLAYVFYFLKLPCPDTVYQVFNEIGKTTSPLAMLILGCSLAQLPLREVFGRWQLYVLCLLKMMILPFLGWLVLRLVLRDAFLLGVMSVILCMPAATNATIISYQYGGDEKLASAGVFLTTLLSVATIPAMMWFLFTFLPSRFGG